MARFTWLDYGIFAVYLAASVLVGVLFVKEQRTIKDYFLAGRSMGRWVVAISVAAALFSGISYLGAPSEVYANGLGFMWTLVGFCFATPFTIAVILPFFYQARFYTAYHYLEERFSVPTRLLGSSLFIIRVVLWLALATYAPALALEQATGMPLWFTILCSGVLTTFYTTLGGMKGVIWTDVMQFVVLVGGQFVIALVALSHVPGGLAGVHEIAQQDGKYALSLSFDPQMRVTLWTVLIGASFYNLVQMATDQVSVQRYLTARSLAEAKQSLWIKLWIVLPFTSIFYLTGLVLYAFYKVRGDPFAAGQITKTDQILPYFVVTELPAGMPGLLIAAIYAASMSTVSAGLNSLTSATLMDFYQRLARNPVQDEARLLKWARWLTLGYGALMLALAFFFAAVVPKHSGLVTSTNTVIGVLGGPLLGLFLLGILCRRTNTLGAVAGCLVGLVVVAAIGFATQVSFMWFTMIGCATTMALGWSVSWLFPAPQPQRLDGLVLENRKVEEK